jgi:hypothetical protein
MSKNANLSNSMIFPKGDKISTPYFIGPTRLKPVTDKEYRKLKKLFMENNNDE